MKRIGKPEEIADAVVWSALRSLLPDRTYAGCRWRFHSAVEIKLSFAR
jgi:hypothetical protein